MVGFSAANNGGTTFFFQEPQAKLKDGAQYPVSFQIDKNVAVTGIGVAVSPVMLVVPVTDPDTVFAQLAAGDNLSVTVAGQSFDEPLVGSNKAITALASCIKAAMANK